MTIWNGIVIICPTESSGQGGECSALDQLLDGQGAEGFSGPPEQLSDDEEETPRPDGATGTSDTPPARTMTMKFCLVHGGMDTQGEIFDDALIYVIP